MPLPVLLSRRHVGFARPQRLQYAAVTKTVVTQANALLTFHPGQFSAQEQTRIYTEKPNYTTAKTIGRAFFGVPHKTTAQKRRHTDKKNYALTTLRKTSFSPSLYAKGVAIFSFGIDNKYVE